VAENRVVGCPYTAITAGGTNNHIEFNMIADFMRELDDGAAIYCFGFKDSVMQGNVVVGSHGRVASAYYLDETSCASKVVQNVAIDSRWPSHNHMSEACEIRNNVFVDRGDQLVTLARCRDFVYAQNFFGCQGTFTVRAARDSVRAWSRNLFCAKQGMQVRWLDEHYTAQEPEVWQPGGDNFLGSCPFEDVAAGDFRLRPASAATEMGIPQLPGHVLEIARRAVAEFAPNSGVPDE
jgi:hypothetical protein